MATPRLQTSSRHSQAPGISFWTWGDNGEPLFFISFFQNISASLFLSLCIFSPSFSLCLPLPLYLPPDLSLLFCPSLPPGLSLRALQTLIFSMVLDFLETRSRKERLSRQLLLLATNLPGGKEALSLATASNGMENGGKRINQNANLWREKQINMLRSYPAVVKVIAVVSASIYLITRNPVPALCPEGWVQGPCSPELSFREETEPRL